MASYRRSKSPSPSQRMYRGFSNTPSLHTITEDESFSMFSDTYAPSEGTFCSSPRSEWNPMMDMSDDGSLQSSSDTDSTVSTNFTESNLPGAGRLLGKLYSSAGKKLEKAMARFVNRAGYGPEATYAKLLDLYRDQRDITDAEAKSLLKHCQKLIDYASSDVTSTKVLALEKLLGIFKIHKLVAFVISADSGDLHSRFIDLTTSIERTAYRTAPEYTQRVFDNALSEFSKVEIHRAGVTLLSSKDRTSDDQLKDALTRLVDGLRTFESAPLSLWYLSWLPGLSIDFLFDITLALNLCNSLATALTDDEIFESVDRENLIETSLYTHEHILNHLDFLTPFRGKGSFKEYLSNAGAESLEEYVEYGESTLPIQEVINVMNDFATAYNRRSFFGYPEMEVLRDYQSTELVYERICSALEELDTTVTVAQVRTLETIIMKLCIELLDYTSSDVLRDKLFAIEKLGLILRDKDVFAWFLSAGPPNLETSILALIKTIDTMRSFESMSNYLAMLRASQLSFSLVKVHKSGVDLLEARGEKLRLTSHGIQPLWDSTDRSLAYSNWKAPWTVAFKALIAYLDSDSPKAASLALQYLCFSCWAFPYGSRPSHSSSLLEQSLSQLDPQLALDLCSALRGALTRDDVFRAIYKNDLFWIAGRMIKCLLSRLDFLKRFCDGEETEENVTVGSSTLNIPSSIALLIDLGDAHKARAIDVYSHYADNRLYTQLSEMKEAMEIRVRDIADKNLTKDAA